MGARGKKPGADLTVVKPSEITALQRAEPPTELTNEQSIEWVAVISRMPAEWFPRETHGLLTQYCRHVVAARRVAQLLVAAEKKKSGVDIPEYDRLLKMQEREGRAIASLATRMRISQQSTLDRERKKPTLIPPPWDEDDD